MRLMHLASIVLVLIGSHQLKAANRPRQNQDINKSLEDLAKSLNQSMQQAQKNFNKSAHDFQRQMEQQRQQQSQRRFNPPRPNRQQQRLLEDFQKGLNQNLKGLQQHINKNSRDMQRRVKVPQVQIPNLRTPKLISPPRSREISRWPKSGPTVQLDQATRMLNKYLRNNMNIQHTQRPSLQRNQLNELHEHVSRSIESASQYWFKSNSNVLPWSNHSRMDFDAPMTRFFTEISSQIQATDIDAESQKYALQLTGKLQERGVLCLRPRDVVPEQLSGPCNEELRKVYIDNQLPLWEKQYGREKAREILQRSPYYKDPTGVLIDSAVYHDVWQAWYIYDPASDQWVSAKHLPLVLMENQLATLSNNFVLSNSFDLNYQKSNTTVRLSDNPEEFITRSVGNPDSSGSFQAVAGSSLSLSQETMSTFQRQLDTRKRWYEFGREHILASVPLDQGWEPIREASSRYFSDQMARDMLELLNDGKVFVVDIRQSLDLRDAASGLTQETQGFFRDIKKIFDSFRGN